MILRTGTQRQALQVTAAQGKRNFLVISVTVSRVVDKQLFNLFLQLHDTSATLALQFVKFDAKKDLRGKRHIVVEKTHARCWTSSVPYAPLMERRRARLLASRHRVPVS